MSRFILGDCVRVMATFLITPLISSSPTHHISSVFVTVPGAPLPVTLTMTGCNLPVMRCTAYSKKTR